MEQMSQFIHQLNGRVSPWIYGPLVFLCWIFLLGLLKRAFFSRIHKWTQKTRTHLDDLVIATAHLPLTILIFGSGLYILEIILPLERKYEQAATIFVQGSVVIATVLFLDRLTKELGRLYSSHAEFAFVSRGILQGLIRGTVIGLGLLVFLDMIGISITPILASLGVGSLAVALALQETLTNFFAGIYLTVDQPVRVGDFIKLETGEEGYVTEIGWRSTRIRTLPNNTVNVPNQKLMASIVTNYYLPDTELAVLVPGGVHYDSDLRKVEDVTIDVARHIMKTVPGGVPTFEPFIRYHTFDQSSINFTVILRGREFVDQHLIKHEFIKALHERYKREGIVIPYPLRTIDIPKEILEALVNR